MYVFLSVYVCVIFLKVTLPDIRYMCVTYLSVTWCQCYNGPVALYGFSMLSL